MLNYKTNCNLPIHQEQINERCISAKLKLGSVFLKALNLTWRKRIVKQAIITSFHSFSISIPQMDPESVLFFDSHIDSHILMEGKTSRAIDRLALAEKSAFLRTCVHCIIALKVKGIPLYLVTPEGSFRSSAYLEEDRLKTAGMHFETYLKSTINYLEDFLKIRIVFCPPQDISYVFKKIPRHTTIFDLDVDYLEEFQPFCYSKASKLKYPDGTISKIGNMNVFFRAVKSVRPDKIIISEIKRGQIKKPSQPFLDLLDFLKKQDYSIKFEGIVRNDEAAEGAIKKLEEYAKIEQELFRTNLTKESQSNQEMFNEFKEYADARALIIRDYFKHSKSV